MVYSGMRTSGHGMLACSIVLLLGLIFTTNCSQVPEGENKYLPVAEFEEQESTFLCWDSKFEDIIIRLTTVITNYDHVTIFYNENHHTSESILAKLKDRKIKTRNVELISFNLVNDNIWIRDYGPVFMRDGGRNIKIGAFGYPHEEQTEYNQFAEKYALKHRFPYIRSKMLSAGGGREINGKGTIILVEAHEKMNNPDLTKEEIEKEYREKFNQTNFIWLRQGIPQDDLFDNGPILDNIYGNGVNGHIDEFCRFANDSTILLAKVDSADFERDELYKVIYKRLEESFEILKNSKDQDGKAFTIVRIPQAPVIFNEAKYNSNDIIYTPVTSYLNFVLTNHTVIIPSYYQLGDPDFIKEKELQAKLVLRSVFKNRKVIMVSSLDLNYSGGGLHCITSYKPKIKKYQNVLSGLRGRLG